MRQLFRFWLPPILLLYAISFTLPVIDNTGHSVDHMSPAPRGVLYGWQAFLSGILMMGSGVVVNLLFLAGVVAMMRGAARGAGLFGLAATAGGLLFLGMLMDRSLAARGRFEVGYFAWVGSMALLSVCGFFGAWRGPAAKPAPVEE